MRRSTSISTLVLAGLIASPVLLHAQANPTSADEQDRTAVMDTAAVNDRDDRSDWGWVGLLGLAGLLGLKRREREERGEPLRTRQAL